MMNELQACEHSLQVCILPYLSYEPIGEITLQSLIARSAHQ